MKYLAFNLEIAHQIPEGETDWKNQRPLGITCAAAASSDGGLWSWYAKEPDNRFGPKMREDECCMMVNLLLELAGSGYTLLTWNDLGFVFDVLTEESRFAHKCQILALAHIDMMFHFHCAKGYPLSLDAAAKGMGLSGKSQGMDEAKAPKLWPTDPHKVMACCSQDVKTTLALAEAVDRLRRLDWTVRSGRPNSWPCQKWLTVKEAMALPEPDTAWMSDPWPRSKFYGWTGYEPPSLETEIYTLPLDPDEWDEWDEWIGIEPE